jgi:hypothetical protein
VLQAQSPQRSEFQLKLKMKNLRLLYVRSRVSELSNMCVCVCVQSLGKFALALGYLRVSETKKLSAPSKIVCVPLFRHNVFFAFACGEEMFKNTSIVCVHGMEKGERERERMEELIRIQSVKLIMTGSDFIGVLYSLAIY